MHTGLAKTAEHTYTLVIVILSVTVTASAQMLPTASNAYHILIVMETKLVSATSTGQVTTVASVSTWKPATQFVIIAMVV